MRVAITGSSGLIGTALAAHLAAGGHEVLRLRRGAASAAAGAGPAAWDPAAGWIAPGALAGCDAVVHLAGASIGEGRWSARRRRELRASRIDATRLLVAHLETLPQRPAVLVCASAVGYYGDRGDAVLDESAAAGSGFLADLVRDWEAEARRAERLGVRVALPRFGVVLARHGGALPRMLLPFRFGLGGRLGSGRQWMPWVTLEDTVRAIAFALAEPALAGAFNVTAPQPVTNAEVTRALGRQLHRPALMPVPRFALRLALGEAADELLLSSTRAVPSRLLAAGFAFTHPDLAGALAAVLGEA